mmetsp:Transcript_21655/g.71654  ORF Transcript_21655/g.71654 Transcript_21655/m.71654 type:complete len:165 (+) Transcript_21655:369-863(+)
MRRGIREFYYKLFGSVVEVDCSRTDFKLRGMKQGREKGRERTSERGTRESGGRDIKSSSSGGFVSDRRQAGKPLASSLIQEMQDSAKKITQELRDSSPAAKPWLAATSNQQTIECLERKEQLLDAKMEDMRRLLRIDAQQIVSFRDDFTSKREQERQSSSTDTA